MAAKIEAAAAPLLRELDKLAGPPAEQPSSLKRYRALLGSFKGSRTMPHDLGDAVSRVGDGLEAIASLRRAVAALQRVHAFEDGMDLLLQGRGADRVRARVQQVAGWESDPSLQALATVARYWSSGERPSRDWNPSEHEVLAVLGLVPGPGP